MDHADDIWKFRQEIFASDTDQEDQFDGYMSLDKGKSSKEWTEICRLRKNTENSDFMK